eukprot:tig00000865_g5074.t1
MAKQSARAPLLALFLLVACAGALQPARALDRHAGDVLQPAIPPYVHGPKAVIALITAGTGTDCNMPPGDANPCPNPGPATLTAEGCQTMYSLGKEMRRSYILDRRVLNESYFAGKFVVHAEDREQSILSGQCFGAGVYDGEGWLRGVQPVSVRTKPLAEDYLNRSPFGGYCKKADCIARRVFSSQDARAVLQTHGRLLHRLSELSGVDLLDSALGLPRLIALCDLMNYEDREGLPVLGPDTTLKLAPGEDVSALHFNACSVASWARLELARNEDLQALAGAPLLQEAARRLEEAHVNGTFRVEAHVADAFNIHSVVGLIGPALGPPAATAEGAHLLLEVYHRHTPHYAHVSVHYAPRYDSPQHRLVAIRNCPYPCSLKKFKRLAAGYGPEDIRKECDEAC